MIKADKDQNHFLFSVNFIRISELCRIFFSEMGQSTYNQQSNRTDYLFYFWSLPLTSIFHLLLKFTFFWRSPKTGGKNYTRIDGSAQTDPLHRIMWSQSAVVGSLSVLQFCQKWTGEYLEWVITYLDRNNPFQFWKLCTGAFSLLLAMCWPACFTNRLTYHQFSFNPCSGLLPKVWPLSAMHCQN